MMKKPVKHRVKWGIVTICTLSILLSGCRLAKEEGRIGKDALIGMLVTTLAPSEEETLSGSGPEREELEGRKTEEGWCEFPQVDGAALTKEYDEEEDVVSVQGPEGYFSDIHLGIHVTDEGEAQEYSGVMNISESFDNTLYFYPVYEREDRSVYARMTEDQYEFGEDSFTQGADYSKSIKEETAVTADGKKKQESISFTVHIKREEALEELLLIEMDENHTVKAETEITREQEKITLRPDTVYVVTEACTSGANKVMHTVHTAYDPGTDAGNSIRRPYEDENHIIFWKYLDLESGE